MATITIGPGKDYPDLATGMPHAGANDTVEIWSNGTDTSFVLLSVSGITIKAAAGYAPSWKRAGALVTANVAALTVRGVIIGVSDNSSPTMFGLNPGSTAGGVLNLIDCKFSFGTGAPSICGATGNNTGTTVCTLNIDGCEMKEDTNSLTTLMGISGTSGTKLGRAVLNVTDSKLKTSSLRVVSGNGLFDSQTIRKSIIKVTTNSGANTDFAPSSSYTLEQSILDGLNTASGLIAIDCAKTALNVKSSYVMRCNGTSTVIVNPVGKPFANCAFHANGTAISASACVTENCQFSGNTAADYTGGGALDATDTTGVTVTFADLDNSDYIPTAESSTRGAGVDMGFTTDIRGVAIPWLTAYDVGPFQFYIPDVTAPEVVSGVRISGQQIRVVFTEAMDTGVASLTDSAEWSLVSGVGAPLAIGSVVVEAGDESVLVTSGDPFTPLMAYTVTAPADVTDLAGNAIKSTAKSATFIIPWRYGRLGIVQNSGAATIRLIEALEDHPRVAEV